MPVLSYRHDEKTTDGKPVFIVRTPMKDFTGERIGVRFFNGEGRTISERRARRFVEEFGYDVMLPKNHKGFEFASRAAVERLVEGDEDEPSYASERPEDE